MSCRRGRSTPRTSWPRFASARADPPWRRGTSNGEIAEHLYISVATAKAHVARLLTKLGARDRVHLVIAAYEAGLVSPQGPAQA
jgi:hypothetical protein